MRECSSKTFTASPELLGTALELDVWLPLGMTNLDTVTVKLIGQEETVRAIMEEGGVPGAWMGEGGGAVLEEF